MMTLLPSKMVRISRQHVIYAWLIFSTFLIQAKSSHIMSIPNDFYANGTSCESTLPDQDLTCPIFGISVRENGGYLTQQQIEDKCVSLGFLGCLEDEMLFPDGTCGRCPDSHPVDVTADGNLFCENQSGERLTFQNPFFCEHSEDATLPVHHRPCFAASNAPTATIEHYYAGTNVYDTMAMEACYSHYGANIAAPIYTVVDQTIKRDEPYKFPVVSFYAQDIDHGFLQCPIYTKKYDYLTPWWIALYVYLGITAVWLGCYYAYYTVCTRASKDTKPVLAKMETRAPIMEDGPSVAEVDGILQKGYTGSLIGKVTFWVLIGLAIAANGFQILINLDVYGITYPICYAENVASCGGNPVFTWRTGFDCASGCLFSWSWTTGFNHLWPYDQSSGGVENVYAILYVSWSFMFLLMYWLKLNQERIPIWFLNKCPLNKATVVYCEKEKEPSVKIEREEKTWVIRCVRYVEDKWVQLVGKPIDQKACEVHNDFGVNWIEFQHLRYLLNPKTNKFEVVDVTPHGTYAEVKQMATKGLDEEQARKHLAICGINRIDIKTVSFARAIFDEFFQCFYIYQFGLLYVWFVFFYWLLGAVVLSVVVASGIIKIIVKRAAENQLKEIAEHVEDAEVLRDGKWTTISSSNLVPGDVFQLVADKLVVADCMLLQGRCVMNESSITGEPAPVPKTSIPNSDEIYEFGGAKNLKYSIMSGTYCESVSSTASHEKVLAIVLSTGSRTKQGELMRSILYPPPLKFKYDDHLKAVLAILYATAIGFFFLVLILMGGNYTGILYGLFTVSNIISPLIPAVFIAGQATASRRLQKQGIFCVNLYRTIVAAKVKICCFDKTGTLTEAGLEFHSVHCANPSTKSLVCFENVEKAYSSAIQLMGCCHELDVVPIDDAEVPGSYRLVGNEIDSTMYQASRCAVKDMGTKPVMADPLTGEHLKILHRYEFERSTMTMSAVVENLTTKERFVFTKGSFESVKKFSKAESIPVDFDDKCKELSSNGFYILGIAMKKFESHEDDLVSLNRKDVERDLEMMGLLVFSNSLKPDTGDAIQELKEGGVRSVMVTGDNILAASKIARDCGLSTTERLILGDMVNGVLRWEDYDSGLVIDDLNDVYEEMKQSDVELGVTGAAFEYLASIDDPLVPLYADIAPSEKKGLGIRSLVPFLRVLARMKPHQKVEAVRYNMEIAVTAMCGDGANDCAALRMSHCGLALGNSNQQATIVAPFNTASTSIRAMITLLIEGRAALATSNVGYKRLILYGQSVAMCKILIYGIGVTVGEGLWIIGDSIINCGLTFIILHTKATKKLSKERPTTRLFGAEITLSILFQLLVGALEYGLCYYLFYTEPEFQCKFFDANLADLARWWTMSDNFEGLAIGFVLIRQLICSGWVLNFGYKFREPWFKNSVLHLFIVALLVYLALILFWEGSFIACINRMNCGDASLLVWWNEELGRSVETGHGVAPPGCPCDTQIVYSPTCEAEYLNCSASSYNQVFHHNIIPSGFKWRLLGLLVGAFALSIIVEKVVMLGPVRSYLKKRKNAKKVHHVLLGHPNTSVLANMESKLHNARNL